MQFELDNIATNAEILNHAERRPVKVDLMH